MKNHIVFKVPSFPTVSETFVVMHIIGAIQRGYAVTILADVQNNPANTSQKELVDAYQLVDKVVTPSQPPKGTSRTLTALFYVCNPLLLYYFIKYCRYRKKRTWTYLFRLKHYLPYRKATAYHVHFATALDPLPDLKAIGFLKGTIVVTFHGHDEQQLPHGAQLKKLVATYQDRVGAITVNSAYLRSKLVNKGFNQEQIKIVPIGVDGAYFTNERPKPSKPPFKLLSIGRLIPLKGHHLGLEVVRQLKQQGRAVHYTIIGKGPREENLKERVTQLEIEAQVTFTGALSQKAIKKELGSHHCLLMTSTVDDTGRRETFGVVSLEAQAMGLPVIGFRSGGFPETVLDTKTGILVPDGDVTAMAEAVKTLMDAPEKREAMGQAAVTHIQTNFDLTHTLKGYFECY
ncbi:glycosyltransferase family 4 protein [Candidatus Ulvibacter alkanivorans]|uniref:glycosyltransferase family 4 protein n=1 Tax=Candidatus Ulvibacter alkanivorans TaxID=2267620 RepID=UPI000DF3C8F9|nr:glycosyltransferase family 4 protein [Candidatus Ulvibacter alkanivorans]